MVDMSAPDGSASAVPVRDSDVKLMSCSTSLRSSYAKLTCRASTRPFTMHRVNGLVEARHVSFAYEARKEVLHDISFTSESRTGTALADPSGADISTILALIAACY